MKNAKKNVNIHALVEAAVLIALAYVLSYVRLFRMPQGGSVTPASMLPLLILGIRRGPAWGVGAGIAYGLLQLLQAGGLASPAATVWSFGLELMLDYVLAFGVLGLSALFRRYKFGLAYSAVFCIALRCICHIVSGVVVWSPYAPEGQNVWLYSLGYSGPFMGVEAVITLVTGQALVGTVPKMVRPQDERLSGAF